MSGVGVANNDYASGAWQNPAAISSVKKLDLTVTLLPVLRRVDAPFTDPATMATRERDGEWQPGALGTLAFGVRLHERVALGLATYVFSGNTIEFQDVVLGQDVIGRAFAAEAQLPVAVTLTEALSVAVAYRITFSRLETTLPIQSAAAPNGFVTADTTTSGWDFAGFAFGVRYRFNDALRVGLTYRTEVIVDLEGDTTTTAAGQSMTAQTEGEYALPHTFKLGGELRLPQYNTRLALDLGYWLYSSSHPRDVELGRPSGYQDAVRGALGVEYQWSPVVALRGGVFVGNSATTEAAATPLAITPGVLWGASIGAGVAVSSTFALDFALALSSAPGTTVSPSDNSVAPGPYEARTLIACASLNYAP